MKILNFPKKKYNIIYADPPWSYKESGGGNRVVSSKYPTMDIEAIKTLPVRAICADTSILFMWVTFPRLTEGLEVFPAWDFVYYGLGFDWVKLSKNKNPSWGMGYYTRQNTEVCLVGVKKDRSKRIKPLVKNILSVVHSERREHSQKPEIIKEHIVSICGDLPRIELFARDKTPGWDAWGNEI